MPEKINDGGPAFPVPGLQNDEAFNGMSLRDYFAAKAMQSLILDKSYYQAEGGYKGWGEIASNELAEEAYEVADAMLSAREKFHE